MQKGEIKLTDRKVAEARQIKWRPLSEGLERKTSRNAKLDQFNENYQLINCTFVQQKRGSTELLKATNRGFSFATARKEGILQA